MSDMIFIGIDPGVGGALAYITSTGQADAIDTPIIVAATGGKTKSGNARKKKQYNEHAIVNWLKKLQETAKEQNFEIQAVLEDVHAMPLDGVSGAFTFGESKGWFRGLLAMAEIPTQMVSPSVWRPAMVGAHTDKAASIVVAQRLFPGIDLSRKKDDGRAEALLMATYLRRKLCGGTTEPMPQGAAGSKPKKRKSTRRKPQLANVLAQE